jgi:hypothetical protein
VHPRPLAAPVTTVSIFFYERRWLALRAVLAVLLLGLRVTVPIMLRGFVRFLQAHDAARHAAAAAAAGVPPPPGAPPPPPAPPLEQGWLWAGGLVAVSLAAIIADAASTWNTQAHSNAIRMQLGAALSAKALRLRGAELAVRFGAGRLLNAFSSDARRVAELNMVRRRGGGGGARGGVRAVCGRPGRACIPGHAPLPLPAFRAPRLQATGAQAAPSPHPAASRPRPAPGPAYSSLARPRAARSPPRCLLGARAPRAPRSPRCSRATRGRRPAAARAPSRRTRRGWQTLWGEAQAWGVRSVPGGVGARRRLWRPLLHSPCPRRAAAGRTLRLGAPRSQWKACATKTASKDASGNGSAAASARTTAVLGQDRSNSAHMPSLGSVAVTRKPRGCASSCCVSLPVPAATSSSAAPGARPRASTAWLSAAAG